MDELFKKFKKHVHFNQWGEPVFDEVHMYMFKTPRQTRTKHLFCGKASFDKITNLAREKYTLLYDEEKVCCFADNESIFYFNSTGYGISIETTGGTKKLEALVEFAKSQIDAELPYVQISVSHDDLTFKILNNPRTTHAQLYPHINLEKVVGHVNAAKPGILLLCGEPGAGKSRLAEHFAHQALKNKRKVFNCMASAMQNIIAGGYHLKDDVKDSLFIIEEGDILIRNREQNKEFPTQFLDMTSGVTAETSNITFLIISNCKLEDVDPAILRKGRLLHAEEFRKFSKSEAQAVIDTKLVPVTKAEAGMTLADLFVEEDNNVVIKISKSIGFS